jgi:hypothetical protein
MIAIHLLSTSLKKERLWKLEQRRENGKKEWITVKRKEITYFQITRVSSCP